MAEAGRRDRLAEGWTRQTIQLPKPLSQEFRQYGANKGQGEIKNVGTVAIGLALGLPPMVREYLVLWAIQTYRVDPAGVTPEDTWRMFLGAFCAWLRTEVGPRMAGLNPEQKRFWDEMLRDAVTQLEATNAATVSGGGKIAEQPYLMSNILGVAVPPASEKPGAAPKSEPAGKRRKKR